MNEQLVTFLREQLRLARKGELLAMTAVLVGPDPMVSTAWAGATDENVYKIIGGIEVLAREFADEHVQGLKAA